MLASSATLRFADMQISMPAFQSQEMKFFFKRPLLQKMLLRYPVSSSQENSYLELAVVANSKDLLHVIDSLHGNLLVVHCQRDIRM